MVESKRPKIPATLKSWSFWLRLTVTSAILIWIVKTNDLGVLAREIKEADPHWLFLGFLCICAAIPGTSLRWWFLLKVQEIHLKLTQATCLVMIGHFFSAFLPGSTGGDVVKIYYTLKLAPERKARAVLTILIDRILGLVTILSVTMLLIPFKFVQIADNPDARNYILILAIFLFFIFLGLATVFFFPLKWLPAFLQKFWLKFPKRDVIESLYQGLLQHKSEKLLTFKAIAAATLSVFFILSSGYCIARSLHLEVSYPLITIIFSLTICAISLPISISGHGVREWMLILMFGIFEVTRNGELVGKETAVAFSLIFLSLGWIVALIGGLTYLSYSHQQKKTV